MAHFNDDGDLELDDNLFEFWGALFDIDEVTTALASAGKNNVIDTTNHIIDKDVGMQDMNKVKDTAISSVTTDDEDATTNLSSSSNDDTITSSNIVYNNDNRDDKDKNNKRENVNKNNAAATANAATASYKYSNDNNPVTGFKRKINDVSIHENHHEQIVNGNSNIKSVLTEQQINAELSKIPARLTRAANAGDMDLLREVSGTIG